MPQVITMGETMAMFSPAGNGPLRYIYDYRLHIAGAESNVAVGVCKLGHTAGWISCLGDDEFGSFVRNMIRAEGVDTSYVRFDASRPTGLMFKQTGAGEESRVFYYRDGSAATALSRADISEEYIAGAEILHISGITPVLSESCCQAVRTAIEMAKAHHVRVSFDPNIRYKVWKDADYSGLLREIASQADILLIGMDEARVLFGCDVPDVLIPKLIGSGVTQVGLKDGSRGAWVGDAERICQIEPVKCTCVDPIGAGDAFDAAFLAGILEGCDIETCGRMGAIAGALATQMPGDIEGYPSAERMEEMLRREDRIFR